MAHAREYFDKMLVGVVLGVRGAPVTWQWTTCRSFATKEKDRVIGYMYVIPIQQRLLCSYLAVIDCISHHSY